uniref:Sel1 repeat family protein n=1 Tax=Steinernema glaseri TaxID=37863 RepID=A0A1I7XYR4_9BILA
MEKSEADREQDERREYVKNIGIEYRFGCYEEKRADSCQLLAEYFEAMEKNAKAAFTLFKANCENRKYPKSCFKYAMYLLAGKECEPSLKKMMEPLQVACDANIPQGCRYLSLVNWNGEEDRKPNSELAEKYMRRACDLEDAEACWLLSTWYMGPQAKFQTGKKGAKEEKEKSELGSLERNMEKALEFAIRACDLDVPQSCANAGRILKIGDGVLKDPDQAKKYLDKAKDIMDNIKKRDSTTGFTG